MTDKISKEVRKANLSRIDKAIEFAIKKYQGQKRPGTELPYIVHLIGALGIAVHYGLSEEIRIAVLLHDILEDTKTKIEEIEEKFGPRVTHLVFSATDDKNLP